MTLMRIGEAAAAAGVSTRTLRYYEQRGLLAPSGHSEGGERRYDDTAVERLRRIRELADLLGADLTEIQLVLSAEEQLASIRTAYRTPGQSRRRQLELLDEAMTLRTGLLARVTDKLAGLTAMQADLQAAIRHIEDLQSQLTPSRASS